MMSGPAPKPTALKVLEGNPGQRKLNTAEPKPQRGAPEPPSWMSDEAAAEWDRIVPELDRLGLLTVVDRAALVAYCEAWATFVDATEAVQIHGVMVIGQKGERVKNPALQVQRDATQTLKAFCAEFGLTPSARSRMTAPGGDDPDEGIADLLS